MMGDIIFNETIVPLNNFNKLYVFSDGVYEITQKDGKEMNLDDYTQLMKEYFSDLELLESEKVLEKIKSLKMKSDHLMMISPLLN